MPTLTTRRDVLRLCATSAIFSAGFTGQGRCSSSEGIAPAKEIPNAYLLAISPNAAELCIYTTRHPIRSFSVQPGRIAENVRPGDTEDALRIIDMSTWKCTYATRLPTLPGHGDFFLDNATVLVEAAGVPRMGYLHLVVDVRNGEKRQKFDPLDSALISEYRALGDRTLIGSVRKYPSNVPESLVRVDAQTFREFARRPFEAPGKPELDPKGGGIDGNRLSGDRRRVAYTMFDSVCCHRTDDLSLLWAQRSDPFFIVGQLALSWDGGLAAVAEMDVSVKRFRVRILRGEDGTEVARVGADASQGLALSPDGRTLAAAQQVGVPGDKMHLQPSVLLFDVASSRKIATLVQDKFPGDGRRGEFLLSGFNAIQFTADGKRLVTSGRRVKVWDLPI